MSVFNDSVIHRRIWRGWDDPGFPEAAYVGWVASTGDLSGGDNVASLILEPEGQPLTGLFFNIEAIELTTTQAGNVPANMRLANMSTPDQGVFFNREWTVEMIFNDASNGALSLVSMLPRPLFLGQSDQPNVSTQIFITTDNVDGDVVVFRIEGYIWGSRATQSPGGLRRPPDALYG